jgi:hypothetical protein
MNQKRLFVNDPKCKHCQKVIYSAGGAHNQGQFGWLHLETGSAKCTQPPATRAEPAGR